jgi:CysZ protein
MALLPAMDAPAEEELGFASGFAHVFIGLRFAYVEHRELAAYFLPPMVVGVLLLICGFVVFANIADDLVSFVWSAPESAFLHVLWSIVSFTVWVVCAAITAVAVAAITMIVAAPFSDVMSERVEGMLGTWSPRPFSARFLLRDIGHTVALELLRALVKLAWLLPLFILSLIVPVIGQFAYVGIGGYLLAKFLGMDYVDWCLARRGYTWKERFAFAKRHRAALVGFGAAITLALIVPFGFVAVWPGAVAGGTILCTRLGPEDKRAPSTIRRRGDA